MVNALVNKDKWKYVEKIFKFLCIKQIKSVGKNYNKPEVHVNFQYIKPFILSDKIRVLRFTTPNCQHLRTVFELFTVCIYL